MDTTLVLDALEHAVFTRRQAGITDLTGLIAHSDAGSQGGFQWSSQHLDNGGVLGWDGGRGRWRYRQRRWAVGASGLRIGRYDRRCVHRGGRSLRVLCSVGSGV
jgi:putative transposase